MIDAKLDESYLPPIKLAAALVRGEPTWNNLSQAAVFIRDASAQVARLTAERDDCLDLIARIAEAQRPHCTTECIEGVWWAKCKSGGVYGPHSTEREALLEVAEMAARTTEEDAITALPADRRWDELRAWIVAMQAKAESYRQWDDLWSMFDLVLDQMDRLADGAENT